MNARDDAVVVFLSSAEEVAALWPRRANRWPLYELLKQKYQTRFPDHDWRQHERMTRELARIAGV